ncbi:hypothetical protein BN1013_00281 [Candidatus Rubidus massiliensis]|nr:MAG: hypothetical protein BGO10_02970 [Chlamydia sp. 32-24]CDZ79783.1 hypothetical protein BN1013_00281 [Candidatus Rubidus massiliensis]
MEKPSQNQENSFSKKWKTQWEKYNQNKGAEGLGNHNPLISYFVLIIGFISFIFFPFLGSFLIGLVFGNYFFKEIFSFFKNFNQFLQLEGNSKTIVLIVTWIIIFLSLPGLIFGLLLATGLKYFLSKTH